VPVKEREFSTTGKVTAIRAPDYNDCCLVIDARPRRLGSADTRTLLVSRTPINQLGRQNLQCSWTSSLETAGFVIPPFQTVAEDVCDWSVGPKRSVNAPPPFNRVLEIVTYFCFPVCCRSNLELSTGTRRLSFHVAILQASLENSYCNNFSRTYSTLVDILVTLGTLTT